MPGSSVVVLDGATVVGGAVVVGAAVVEGALVVLVLAEVAGDAVVLGKTVVVTALSVLELLGDVVDVPRSNNPQPVNTSRAIDVTATAARALRSVITVLHPRIRRRGRRAALLRPPGVRLARG